MKIKICRKESKESAYWLRLVITNGSINGRRKKSNQARSDRVKIDIHGHS